MRHLQHRVVVVGSSRFRIMRRSSPASWSSSRFCLAWWASSRRRCRRLLACRTLVAPATASAGPACGEACRPREVRAKCARASSFHARARSGHILEILSRCGCAVKRIPADSRHRAKGAAAFRTESAAHELVSPLRWCPRETTRRSWRVTTVLRCAVTQSHRPRHRKVTHRH